MKVPTVEEKLGIEVYASPSPGIGGKIRQFPEDFKVEEILADGSRAKIDSFEPEIIQKRGRHLICVLVKRNWDTLQALQEIARHLNLDEDRIQIAGIKDAKALTAQHISISRFLPDQVSSFQLNGITLHPLRFSSEALFPSLLLGNQFHIIVRAIPCTFPVIEQHIKSVKDELSSLGGFTNFFGHQRFGTIRPITHLVGKMLLQGKLESAVFTFLAQPSPKENPESTEARKQLRDTRDFRESLHRFPKRLKYERLMLSHLAKQPRDFAGAFRKLPLKLRKLFVQAYESFLFNKFLSQRIKQGISLSEAQTGDYAIYMDEKGLPSPRFTTVDTQSLQNVNKAVIEGEMCLALPIVGFRQSLSDGLQGEIEREILEREGVSPADFCISLMPEISVRGGLRTILAPIIDLSTGETTEDPANPSKMKTSFAFTLHRGSYATVLLREFMKPIDMTEAGF